MSNERDRQLESILSSQAPPEHRAGFWDDVRAEIADEPVAPVRSLDRARRQTPLLLAAAAVLLVVAVVGFGALTDDDGDVDVTTDPNVEDGEPDVPGPDESTPETTPDQDPDADVDDGPLVPGDPVERGDGYVVATSADGRWLYVAADAPGDDTGCEGADRRALFVEPIGGGERRLAASPEDLDATTISTLHFDGAGRVSTVVQCEGFGARIVTGSVADDGTVDGIDELTIPEPDCHDGPVDGILDIAYTGAGELVAATHSFGDGTDSCYHLFSLRDTVGEPTQLGSGESNLYVDVLPDGRLVTVTFDGTVSIDGQAVVGLGDGGVTGLSASPSGRSLAVSRSDAGADDVVVGVDGSDPQTFATEAYETVLVDDVNGIMTGEVDGQRVVATFRAGDPDASVPIASGNVYGFAVASGGDRVFVTVTDDVGENARILEVALSR